MDVEVDAIEELEEFAVRHVVAGALHGFGQESSFTEWVDVLTPPVAVDTTLFVVAAGFLRLDWSDHRGELEKLGPVDGVVRPERAILVSLQESKFDGAVGNQAVEGVVHDVGELRLAFRVIDGGGADEDLDEGFGGVGADGGGLHEEFEDVEGLVPLMQGDEFRWLVFSEQAFVTEGAEIGVEPFVLSGDE